MRIKQTISILTFLSIVLASCEEMSLDPNVENTFGDQYTWRFGNYAEGVLLNAYSNVPARFNSYENNFLDVATDNAVTNSFGSGIYDVASAGSISAHSNPIASWNQPFDQFRNIHLFLENGLAETVSFDITTESTDSLIRSRLKGEAFFLRAWWGFQLLQNFGGKTSTGEALGYPIVTRTLTEQEFVNLNDMRNTYEECVNQIIADIDTAVYYLPVEYTGSHTVFGISGLGRANDQVALALKSRVLLYAASPAYQSDNITQITGMGQFVVVDAVTNEAKWVKATQAAQEAINLTGNIKGLDVDDFNANSTPDEFVWRKYHDDRELESLNYPPLNYGSGVTSPSQNLVDAFPAANGYPIDHPNSNYDPLNPYANRDPRLTLNVLHNGQPFIEGETLETFVGGKDSKAVHFQNTRTGYYLRKWLHIDNMLHPENPANAHHYHSLIRKTEMLLNFAEASNEAVGPTGIVAGCDRSAVDVITQIRNNAGVGNAYVTEVAGQGKDAFRKLIQNERRLELAFENHRYFDMRRWLLPLNESVTGVTITRNADGTLTHEEVVVEERKFDDIRYYYLPIPFNEQMKSSDLVNNLGW